MNWKSYVEENADEVQLYSYLLKLKIVHLLAKRTFFFPIINVHVVCKNKFLSIHKYIC